MHSIQINRSESISIHTQLMEQLKYHIESGAWKPGKQLPTVRELAKTLRINYNTVRAAYRELERQGYLVSIQGRGTFVALDAPGNTEDQQETLLDIVDEALIRAMASGVSTEEFAQAAYTRARLFPLAKPEVRLLFSECNPTDLAYYANTIRKGTGVAPESILLEDLRKKERRFFEQFDLIATTLFHVTELQKLAGPQHTVLGLMLEPDYLEVLSEIARLQDGARVGLICAVQTGAEAMERALVGVGATYPRFMTAGIDQPEQIERIFQECDQIYVSRIALRQYQGSWPDDKSFRLYVDDLDDGAIRLLRRQIARVHFSKQRTL